MSDVAARLAVAAVTHAGCVRSHNEDFIAAGGWLQGEPMRSPRVWNESLDKPVVCMVLDGMGGYSDGEIASSLAAAYLARELPSCTTETAIAACIGGANRHLYDRMQNNATYLGMGTTLAGMRIAPDGIVVFNVGDSRVYRAQDGYLSQLSVDDVPKPAGPPSGAVVRTGVITQSLGGTKRYTEIVPHISVQSIALGRTYLVCSDGLYDALDIDAMESAIDADLGVSAERLLGRALEAGARDNVSFILLRIENS